MCNILEAMYEEACQEYQKGRDKSKAFYERADKIIPGGESRSCILYDPFNFVVDKAKGYLLHDVDGFEYTDYINNYMSLIHGHADPDVVAAVQEQVAKGTAYAAPCEKQYELADMIVSRSKYIDAVQFCNSGTEALQGCARLARTYTGKDIIIRLEGVFNGSGDMHAVSEWPDLNRVEGKLPQPILEAGITKAEAMTTVPVPINDLELMEYALKKYNGQVAAIFIEGLASATLMRMTDKDYLIGLRQLATKYGALLVVDEVITYRLSLGGFHCLVDLEPDLVGMGKIIGGGLPVGAFAGKKEIMRHLDPKSGAGYLGLSGTFSGNPLTMAAGIATLKKYDQAAIDRINGLGDRLKAGIIKGAADAGIPLQVTGYGSLLGLHFTKRELKDCADEYRLMKESAMFRKLFHMEEINMGYYTQMKGRFTVSTAMNEALIDKTIEDYAKIFKKIKPAYDASGIQ